MDVIIPDSDDESQTPDVFSHQDSHSLNVEPGSPIQVQSRDGDEMSVSDEDYIPADVMQDAKDAEVRLIPGVSKRLYDKVYIAFKDWMQQKKIKKITDFVLLGYFHCVARKAKPTTLWSRFSMLKKTLSTYEAIDISQFPKVRNFLAVNSKGYEPKKSQVLNDENIDTFIREAPDVIYLAIKVALIIGFSGLCRTAELYQMKVENVVDRSTFYTFTLPREIVKTNKSRVFVVDEEYYPLLKRYISLRPKDFEKNNFFVKYQNGRCVRQVMGQHKMSGIPREVAEYLNLPNASRYTGHCYRRSGATVLVDSGADTLTLKRAGGWKSGTIAEGYAEESEGQKKKVAAQIKNAIKKPATTPREANKSPSSLCNRIPQPVINDISPIPLHDVSPDPAPNLQLNQLLRSHPNINLNFYNCSNFKVFDKENKENK
ncbi:uncharacterized protein LOC107046879 [Diachasma alloeum]|uniref:uncharacterized protein LOC107046879 n=1 Tax=Diachasma alloeum TaxID=454923 RepID=UPI00073815C3|nr:uncharacterized protein LOC107046879 [Diachasma alloeum]